MDRQIESIIERLKLQPHPEGGWYAQTYRSAGSTPPMGTGKRVRPWSTSIYFLLTGENFSAFHRLKSDELWYHHAGDALAVEMIDAEGRYERLEIGSVMEGYAPQAIVPGGCWFASHPLEGSQWALVGCGVAPGFDFDDFELAEADVLAAEYPQHEDVIRRYTRA